MSRGSSVSIVSAYGLDDRAIDVRSPVEARDFSSILCVQTGSGAHPASCTMGTGGPFPGGKARPGRDADHSPHLVPRSIMSRSYTSSPPLHLYRYVLGQLNPFRNTIKSFERTCPSPLESNQVLRREHPVTGLNTREEYRSWQAVYLQQQEKQLYHLTQQAFQ
jgi:hypothetical protein